MRLPHGGKGWAEAEPGIPWLNLDNELRQQGIGLAVYPTSAPRATVGGWLATDSLGVGSFEYGWLHENVLSVSVVLVGGEQREIPGSELKGFFSSGDAGGIVVSAKLRTRQANRDVPFAATFRDVASLTGAVTKIMEERPPLWHLAFLSPEMSRLRSVGEDYLLFGAYSGEHGEVLEESLREVFEDYGGKPLSTADVYLVWGQRFFPIAPSHPSPNVTREFTSVAKLSETLDGMEGRAVQGTVARSGETLLLSIEDGKGRYYEVEE